MYTQPVMQQHVKILGKSTMKRIWRWQMKKYVAMGYEIYFCKPATWLRPVAFMHEVTIEDMHVIAERGVAA